MADLMVFRWIGDAIKTVTDQLLLDSVSNVTGGLAPLLLSAVTLYITIRAWLLIFGRSDDPASAFIISSVQIICITFLTLNAANYTEYVIGTINGWETGLTSLIVPNGNSNTVMGLLDVSLNTAIDQVAFAWAKVEFNPSTWGWAFAAIAIIIAYLPLTIIIAITVIGAQFLLTILLIIGPLFISFAMFPVTRKYFDSWVAKVFENVLVLVFGVMIIGFVMSLFNQFVVKADLTANGIHPVGTAILLLPVSAILLYVIKQIPNLAGSLSGGFASANLTLQELRKGLPPIAPVAQGIEGTAKTAGQGLASLYYRLNPQNTIGAGVNKPHDLSSPSTKEQIQTHTAASQPSSSSQTKDSLNAQHFAASHQRDE